MKRRLGVCLALALAPAAVQAGDRSCPPTGVQLQILGSGGAELSPERAGSGYLIWVNGRARVLVDVGHGTAMRFAQTGARVDDLEAVLLTHIHADHTADLAPLVQAALAGGRTRPLALHGPTGNRFAPSVVTFVRTLFDATRGVWRHLGDVLNPMTRDGFKLAPHEVRERPRPLAARRAQPESPIDIEANGMALAATPMVHGVYPALAWRVRVADKTIVFTGDMNGEDNGLARLAHGADILVASHTIAEGAGKAERFLHMPPSVIGQIAARTGVRQLVLVHRGAATLGREAETTGHIRQHYTGALGFGDDLACYTP